MEAQLTPPAPPAAHQVGLYHAGRTVVDAALSHYQLDCQLPSSEHPVVLTPIYPQPPRAAAAKRAAAAAANGGHAALGHLSAAAPAADASGAGGERCALRLRLKTLAHPTVLLVEDLTVALTRLNVEIDDELLGGVSKRGGREGS